MARPKLLRDPIHGQIRFDSVDLGDALPQGEPERAASWMLRQLIECPEFQRLRHIRQNGLTNFVFPGAEHSRFTHSLGACHLAGEMFHHIARNMDEKLDTVEYVATRCAALLHDVGHGPFSHTMEEILEELDVEFNHEHMTRRFIEEEGSAIKSVLEQFDPGFPRYVAAFIDKESRGKPRRTRLQAEQASPPGSSEPLDPPHDRWIYKLVSSQLDADRLDYLQRDATFAGVIGSRFDLPRLLDMLQHLDGTRISVDRKAIEAVEGYLIALDQMYRSVYFHHTVRAASVLLSATIRRAFRLYKNGDRAIFGVSNPLRHLVDEGESISLADYARLGEFHVWTLLEEWSHNRDEALATLANKLLRRQLFKTIDLDTTRFQEGAELIEQARRLAREAFPFLSADADAIKSFVIIDEPQRTSYKRYDWRAAVPDESIWLVGGPRKPSPIEEEDKSKIITALKDTKYFQRLVFPAEIRDKLQKSNKKG
jgi:uncharacterized protein